MADKHGRGLDADGLVAFLTREFPAALSFGARIAEVGAEGVTLALDAGADHLRPGGTVMGPTLMTLADTAMYLSVLSQLGEVVTFTSSLEMHFLRRPTPGVLTARCRILRLGRRLAVGSVEIADAGGQVVGLSTVTYVVA
jgi:uncharacterized protein (TIGR00369 family)